MATLNNSGRKVDKMVSFQQLQVDNQAILPKRKLKEIDKMSKILDAYFNQRKKPKEIAK